MFSLESMTKLEDLTVHLKKIPVSQNVPSKTPTHKEETFLPLQLNLLSFLSLTVKVLQFPIQTHLIITTTFDKQYPAFTYNIVWLLNKFVFTLYLVYLFVQSHLTIFQLTVYTQNSSSTQFYRNAQDFILLQYKTIF